jgi:hypothetical protein
MEVKLQEEVGPVLILGILNLMLPLLDFWTLGMQTR